MLYYYAVSIICGFFMQRTEHLEPPEVHTINVLQFESDEIIVDFHWTSEDGVSYALEIIPQANSTLQTTAANAYYVQLHILYNTVYNVTLHSSTCRQINAMTSFMLNLWKVACWTKQIHVRKQWVLGPISKDN